MKENKIGNIRVPCLLHSNFGGVNSCFHFIYINTHVHVHKSVYQVTIWDVFQTMGCSQKEYTDPGAEGTITVFPVALPSGTQRAVILSISVKSPEFRALALGLSQII